MTDKLVKPVAKGLAFALVSGLLVTLVVTLLLYFEIVGVTASSRILYGAFCIILLLTSFMTARRIGSRGLFVGLGIAGGVVVIGAIYRLIGVEAGLNFAFLTRSAITTLISTGGAVLGVNTVK